MLKHKRICILEINLPSSVLKRSIIGPYSVVTVLLSFVNVCMEGGDVEQNIY